MGKLINKENMKNYIIGVIALILAIAAYFILPDIIPVHFNAQGIADSFGDKITIFLMPAICIGVTILSDIARHVDPKESNYSKFEKQYSWIIAIVCLFIFMLECYIIGYSMKWIEFNISMILFPVLGILFIVIGNAMPKIKSNYFVGIKTPWTINNETVWFKTHRFAGKLWFVCGILLCMGVLLPVKYYLAGVLSIIAISVVIPVIYSYVVYREL